MKKYIVFLFVLSFGLGGLLVAKCTKTIGHVHRPTVSYQCRAKTKAYYEQYYPKSVPIYYEADDTCKICGCHTSKHNNN